MPQPLKKVTEDCECCDKTGIAVTLMDGMLMCEDCIARVKSVVRAEKVITESRQNDVRIQHKEDVYAAITTSFIELHGAILANPEIPADQKKYALAELVTERIKSRDAAIFQAKAELAKLEQERFGWLKNLQPLVSTLRTEEQSKFKQFNVNYKPTEPGIVKIRKVAKSGTKPSVSSSTSARYTHKQVKEACEAAGADIVSVRMRLAGNKNITLEQAIQKYLSTIAD